MKKHIATWQLPKGVSSGTWDYVETTDIATSYDEYLRQHGMFRLDEEVVRRYSESKTSAIDLGCGTGRAVWPMVQQGIDCVACDLSQAMLEEVKSKCLHQFPQQSVLRVRANLVDLDCFQRDAFDLALCLFSTLGMIRGGAAREQFLNHVQRMLAPGGHFVLQVHNYWAHLYDPNGPWWMLRNLVRTKLKQDVEIGDRFYPYRGIPKMYLHSFSFREIQRLLRNCGFKILESIPLNKQQNAPLGRPTLAGYFRASGWIVVATPQ